MTPLLVECDEQPVLLQEVEAASCRRRHETKHLLMTQYLWWQSHYILNRTNWPLPCPWQLWPCQPCDGRFVYENLSFPIPFRAKWYPNIGSKGSFFFYGSKEVRKVPQDRIWSWPWKEEDYFSFILRISYRTGGRLVEGCPFTAQLSGEMMLIRGVPVRSGSRPW